MADRQAERVAATEKRLISKEDAHLEGGKRTNVRSPGGENH